MFKHFYFSKFQNTAPILMVVDDFAGPSDNSAQRRCTSSYKAQPPSLLWEWKAEPQQQLRLTHLARMSEPRLP